MKQAKSTVNHGAETNEIFSQEARYIATDEASPSALAEDCAAFLATAEGIVLAVTMAMEDKDSSLAQNPHIAANALYGAQYLMRFARGAADESARRAFNLSQQAA